METVIERCCGLDVHQGSVVACIIVIDQHRKPRREIRTFGTMTKDLDALRKWLETEVSRMLVMRTHISAYPLAVRRARAPRPGSRGGSHGSW